MDSPKKVSRTAKRIYENGSATNLKNLQAVKKLVGQSGKDKFSQNDSDDNVIDRLTLGSRGEKKEKNRTYARKKVYEEPKAKAKPKASNFFKSQSREDFYQSMNIKEKKPPPAHYNVSFKPVESPSKVYAFDRPKT